EVLRQRPLGSRHQGGPGTHRRRYPVDRAVCQAVACRPPTAAGRDLAAARPGDPTGVGGLARAGEPVPALRLRFVDGRQVSDRPVGSVCRRCRCALRQPTAGSLRATGDHRQDGAGRATTASRQDQDRLLQGRQASRGVCDHVLHVPGVHLPRRTARGRNGRRFTAFLPAISKDALKKLSRTVRGWRLHRRTGLSLAELARTINPGVGGWMRYYGAFYRSALSTLLARINTYLVRWIRKKYKRLRAQKKARAAWERVTRRYPGYFAHWAWVRNPLMIKMAGAECRETVTLRSGGARGLRPRATRPWGSGAAGLLPTFVRRRLRRQSPPNLATTQSGCTQLATIRTPHQQRFRWSRARRSG